VRKKKSNTLGRTDVTGAQFRYFRENVLDMTREKVAVALGMSVQSIITAEQRGRGYIQSSLAIRITNGEKRDVTIRVECNLDPDRMGDVE